MGNSQSLGQAGRSGLVQTVPGEGGPGPSGSVLVVDDAESTVLLVKRIFDQRPGYELVGASTGEEALEVARSRSFDLILMDLHLPDINGDEVVRQLKAQEQTRDIPVVIVTADAAFLQREAHNRVEANGYFTKPFRTHDLLALVDGYIEQARARV